jgi:hypothetical protein
MRRCPSGNSVSEVGIHALSWVVKLCSRWPSWLDPRASPSRSSLSPRRGRGHRAGASGEAQTVCARTSRQGRTVAAQARKHPDRRGQALHPFLESAYSGGGFALGAGYMQHVSPFNFVDVRGSYSLSNYKRAEIEFVAPRIFHRRGELSLLGGWREATQVGFRGLGDRLAERQPGELRVHPSLRVGTAHTLAGPQVPPARRRPRVDEVVAGPGQGRFPSVDTVYTPATLPGLGRRGDLRPHPGHAGHRLAHLARLLATRRGLHRHRARLQRSRQRLRLPSGRLRADPALPVLREAWVFSFRALASTTIEKGGQEMPFFMLPYLGGSSTLRGYHEPALPRSEQPAPSG